MLRRVWIAFGACAVILMSCGTEETSTPVNSISEGVVAENDTLPDTGIYNDDPATQGQSRNLANNEGVQPTLAEVLERADSLLAKDPIMQKENNTTSVYRYLTSSPKYSVIGAMVKASTFSKTLHHDRVTFFAPSDDKWDVDLRNRVMNYVKTDNIRALDRYLGQYFIKRQIDPSKLEDAEKIGDQNGNAMVFDYDQVLYVNGLEASLQPISTLNGFVVDLEAPFPTME